MLKRFIFIIVSCSNLQLPAVITKVYVSDTTKNEQSDNKFKFRQKLTWSENLHRAFTIGASFFNAVLQNNIERMQALLFYEKPSTNLDPRSLFFHWKAFQSSNYDIKQYFLYDKEQEKIWFNNQVHHHQQLKYYNLLCIAAYHGNIPMVKLLLENNADPNYTKNSCITPLEAAVDLHSPLPIKKYRSYQQRKKLIAFLLHYGAKSGNAIEVACKNGFHDLAHTIEHYDSLKTSVFDAIKNANNDDLKKLATKVTFMLQDEDGNTPLHKAIVKGNKPIVERILQVNPYLLSVKNKQDIIPFQQLVVYGTEMIVDAINH